MSSLPLRFGHTNDDALLVGSSHRRRRRVSHGISAKNQSAYPPPSSPFSYRTTHTGSPVTYSAQSTRPLARYPPGRLRTVVTCRRIRGGGFFLFSCGVPIDYRNRRFDRVWKRKVCAYHKNSTGCCYGPFNDLYLPIFSSPDLFLRRLTALSRTTCQKPKPVWQDLSSRFLVTDFRIVNKNQNRVFFIIAKFKITHS